MANCEEKYGLMMNSNCDHTLSILWPHRNHKPSKQQEKHYPLSDFLTTRNNKCDTWDRLYHNRDDTCVEILKTLCMSVTDVYMAKTNCIHKYKPSKSLGKV